MLKVLFLASEADPFVKIGGLGDVAGSLPMALRALGDTEAVDVRLVIPLHGVINQRQFDLRLLMSLEVKHASGPISAEVFYTELNGLPVYLIAGAPLPADAPVYSNDWGFDAHKYIFFSLAALELGRALKWQPDILHANDWHTAPAVYSLHIHRTTDVFYRKTATLLSVHNLPYLGVGGSLPMEAFGLPPASGSMLPEWAQHLPLPLGLLTADKIVAVSPTYSREILTHEFGSGLHDFLHLRQDRITGIINGLDTARWNPATDPALPATFDSQHLENRGANKAALQREFGFSPQPNVPLLTMITRMDYQKGIDLVPDALQQVLGQPWQAILLGTGTPEIEDTAHQLEKNYPDRVRAVLRFDAALSRRLYAGADAIMIPSRYEPCGLSQMIAMRYGCIPIARATGGLRDTIQDEGAGQDTGFLFDNATPEALAEAIRRMLAIHALPGRWQAMQRLGMQQDFSWSNSARQYSKLYQELASSKK
jgi:starch synthase